MVAGISEALGEAWEISSKTIGIDEHFFSRKNGYREFATVVVDYNNKRGRELAHGRSIFELERQLSHIPGRENVKQVVLDLSDTYKSFAKQFFQNSKLIADKFHVLRLLNPAINRYRKEITGDKRANVIRKLLLRSGINLEYFERKVMLVKWREEVLNYFENRITNARTEGFNNVAKLIQKRAYGVKSFKFYRLRYLSACLLKTF